MALTKTRQRLNAPSQEDIDRARMAELMAKEAAGNQSQEGTDRARMAELQKKAAGKKDPEAWYEDFGEGLAVSGMEMYYGGKDLFGQLDEEDKATLKDWQDDAAESGWGTAGQVTGELATFMIPGGMAMKGLKLASKLKNAGLIKKMGAYGATEGVVGAGVGGVKLPEEGETRLENMMESGAAGAAGGSLGAVATRVLSKTMRGLDKTDEAVQLLDEGIYLTPGQMAKSQAISGLETAAEVTPFLARGTKAAKQKGTESWNLKILNEAAPEGTTITKLGPEGGAQLKTAVSNAYDNAWSGSGKLSKQNAKATIEELSASGAKLGSDDSKTLSLTIDEIVEVFNKDVGNKGNKLIDDILRRRLKSAGTDKYDLTQALKQAKEGLRRRMPRNTQERLAKVDAKYPKYLTVRKAIGNSDTTDGIFTPNTLTKADKAISKGKSEVGESLLGKSAKLGRKTVGKKEGGQPLEWFRRIAGAFPSPPGMEGAGRTLMGQTGPQRRMVERLRSPRVQAMRDLFSSGGAAAALFTD